MREEDLADFHVDVEEPTRDRLSCGIDVCFDRSVEPRAGHPAGAQRPGGLRPARTSATIRRTTSTSSARRWISPSADREAYYGDPEVRRRAVRHAGVEGLCDAAAIENPAGAGLHRDARAGIGARTPPDARNYQPGDLATPAQPDTSYVCVIDEEGNAFSATPSDGISGTPIVPGLGLICSGRGSQSWLDPNHASSLQPGKRPRLTPNPAIAFREGRLFMPFGTPGADMQPQSMIQVFLNIVEFGMDPQEAIEQPRFGTYNYPESFAPHTYRPGLLKVESRIDASTVEELRARGHHVDLWPEWTRTAGNVCAITVDHARGTLTGGADARAEAYALGW